MPKALQVCTVPECPELTRSGRCDEHAKQANRKRDRAGHSNDATWRRVSRAFLRDYPLCWDCAKPATVVDHVRSWASAPALRYDRSNLRSLCRSCHGKKTVAVDGGFGRYYADGQRD